MVTPREVGSYEIESSIALALGNVECSDDLRNGGDGDRSEVSPLRASKSAFSAKSRIRWQKGSLLGKSGVTNVKGFRSAWRIYNYKSTTALALGGTTGRTFLHACTTEGMNDYTEEEED